LKQTQKDLNFISHRENKDGLYEKIFNDETKFEDMLCAFYVSSVCAFSFSNAIFENMLPYKISLRAVFIIY
jgi:hypothetical protein